MSGYVIGVDAGGTKTSACAFALDGAPLARHQAGPGSFSADPAGAERAVFAAIDACRAAAGAGCRYVAVGAAGLRGAGLGPELTEKLRARYGCGARAVDDGLLALYAKLQGQDGVLVIAGTGSVAYGKAGGHCASQGGWGHLLDDRGSGTAIALALLRQVTAAWDMGRPLSALEEAVLRRAGCETPLLVPRFVYGAAKGELAALAPLAEQFAGQDEAADRILRQAGEDLAAMAAGTARRLALTQFSVAVSGSILEKCPPVAAAFWRQLTRLQPGATPAAQSAVRAEEGALWFYRETQQA